MNSAGLIIGNMHIKFEFQQFVITSKIDFSDNYQCVLTSLNRDKLLSASNERDASPMKLVMEPGGRN